MTKKPLFFLYALLFCFGTTFIACDREEMDDDEYENDTMNYIAGMDGNLTEYPAAIDDYIATNYPNATIEEIELEDGNYEVELSTGIELLFDEAGAFISEYMDDDEDEDEDDD